MWVGRKRKEGRQKGAEKGGVDRNEQRREG